MKKIWAVFAAGALSVLLGAAAYAEGYEYLFMLDGEETGEKEERSNSKS